MNFFFRATWRAAEGLFRLLLMRRLSFRRLWNRFHTLDWLLVKVIRIRVRLLLLWLENSLFKSLFCNDFSWKLLNCLLLNKLRGSRPPIVVRLGWLLLNSAWLFIRVFSFKGWLVNHFLIRLFWSSRSKVKITLIGILLLYLFHRFFLLNLLLLFWLTFFKES